MNGSVHRRRDSGTWEYRFELGPDPMTGRRRRIAKAGFPTKREAAAALRTAIQAHERGRSVKSTRRTVANFL